MHWFAYGWNNLLCSYFWNPPLEFRSWTKNHAEFRSQPTPFIFWPCTLYLPCSTLTPRMLTCSSLAKRFGIWNTSPPTCSASPTPSEGTNSFVQKNIPFAVLFLISPQQVLPSGKPNKNPSSRHHRTSQVSKPHDIIMETNNVIISRK